MSLGWTAELRRDVEKLGADAGFDIVGIAAAFDPSCDPERFARWVEAGRAGEMEYLKRRDEQGMLLRSSIPVAIPWARSVIVCAMNYNAVAPRSIDPAPPETGWIARYAWSGKRTGDDLLPSDYHDDLLTRLRRIEEGLCAEVPCETRCYVDTGPIVERDVAARAGIGWIGKNTCVLNQRLGSWMLLGVVVTSLPLPQELTVEPAADRCGSCTRCMDACPTNALVAPRQMDASLCIAYLTIEKKGSIPEELRAPVGRQVFGCDICQDVCPWNRKAPISRKQDTEPRMELVNPALAWLAKMDAAAFKRAFKGSPLERTRRKRLHRNVAIAMGNSGEPGFLPQLEHWSTAEDPVLAESARWAMERIREKVRDQ